MFGPCNANCWFAVSRYAFNVSRKLTVCFYNFIMLASFIENYKARHQHPLNRLSHSIGIPMIVVSLPLFFFNWRWALGLFIFGWILQFVGHAIEGNQPAFFSNPVYLLIGPLWLLRRVAGVLHLSLPERLRHR